MFEVARLELIVAIYSSHVPNSARVLHKARLIANLMKAIAGTKDGWSVEGRVPSRRVHRVDG